MTRGFGSFHRLGHAAAGHKPHAKRDANPSCKTGGFYKSPIAGDILNSDNPVNLTWDTTCLDTTKADIYLYAPSTVKSRVYLWKNADFTTGTFSQTLHPKWWNSTDTQALQFLILPAGKLPYSNTLPAAPIFNATYTANDANKAFADTSHPDSGITDLAAPAAALEQSRTSGKIAAGILVPLLFLVAAGVLYWFKEKRTQQTKEKTKRFSEMVDKRMSTISHDWKAMSGAGANAAVRASMHVPNPNEEYGNGNRASEYSFGTTRPFSTVASDGGHAGVGAAGTGLPSHIRPGFRPGMGERVSRISFADGTRPSGEYRRNNATSRAFPHPEVVPPLPQRMDSDPTGIMSPTQTQGAMALSPEEINRRISTAAKGANVNGMEDVMPALSMMRTGGSDIASGNELILPPPTPPAPAQMKSSPVGTMPMQPMPANVMSPDDMLRAYAGRRPGTPSNSTSFPSQSQSQGGGATSNISYPMPVQTQGVNYDGNGMRTLYSPVSPATPIPGMSQGAYQQHQQHQHQVNKSLEYGYGYDDAYAVGKAE